MLNAVTVEGIIEGGMKPLLQSLFHVYLEEQKTEEDELWHHSAPITKYQVIHESRVVINEWIVRYRVSWVIYIWIYTTILEGILLTRLLPLKDAVNLTIIPFNTQLLLFQCVILVLVITKIHLFTWVKYSYQYYRYH